ncbi:MAG: hypothetical protein KDB03_26420 [Planctomycetales bacterium]|nr:hypothetical protein [Planctomycetales bacterium]
MSIRSFALNLLLVGYMVCTVGLAASPKPDGTWKWESDLDGRILKSTLRLESDGKKVSGTYSNNDLTAKVEKGEIDGENLWFEIRAKVDGVEYQVKFNGEVSDKRISGDIEVFDSGSLVLETDWNANRVLVDEDVTGKWKFEFTAPDGVKYEPVISVRKLDGHLTGSLMANDQEIALTSVEIKDNQLRFEYAIDYSGSNLKLRYRCDPRGSSLTGVLNYEIDGNSGNFEVSATKQSDEMDLAKGLVGNWQLSFTDPDGQTHSPTLGVAIEGKSMSISLTVENSGRTLELRNVRVEDGKLKFESTPQRQGRPLNISFSAQAEGDQLVGSIDYEVQGNRGQIPVKGKRL